MPTDLINVDFPAMFGPVEPRGETPRVEGEQTTGTLSPTCLWHGRGNQLSITNTVAVAVCS